MNRRKFLQIAAASSPLLHAESGVEPEPPTPDYHIVTPYHASAHPGIPGPYKGQVARVHADRSIDANTGVEDPQVVREMLSRGMRALTGEKTATDAWRQFISPNDIVGVKVNCSGAPHIMSSPEIVGGIVDSVVALGVPPEHVYIYERFLDQLVSVHFERYVPKGVHIEAVEVPHGSILGYDPNVYVEVDFFGEEDTRSNMVRLVTEKFTKIINVPVMKEHQAAGVTGCLKNMAYGDFSNVARSHLREVSNTYTFIGTLASVEPLPSKVVLNIMDGLHGVWHRGPFSEDPRFRFYPKEIMFGTDPVAMDRLLLDVIDKKRKEEHARSIWDRSKDQIRFRGPADPNFNHFIREPGHIKYASKLGLGVYDINKIKVKAIEL